MTPVLIRLDVEAMKYQVVHAFAQRSQEIQHEIETGITAALKDFDFVAVVREEIARCLRKSVADAVANACVKIAYDPEVSALLTRGAAAKVRDIIRASFAEADPDLEQASR